jgi:3-hydroxyisobutyrate dehydrogenase-like beta-hydroxyacid dehydrogenase
MDIAFLGLGNMGMPMARNLLKAGHNLTVYNRTRSRAAALQSEGAALAATPAEAVAHAEAMVRMLADDAAVEALLFEPGNALDALRPGAVHVSMSTISVGLSRRLAQAHRDKRQQYLAATVLGRPEAAAAARLFIMVAGPREALASCQPLLDAMGQKTFSFGEDPASANVVKLAVNFLLTSVIEGLAESIALVRKHRLDPQAFLDFLTTSVFSAPVYKVYGSMIAADEFEPAGFKMPLGLKDNRLVLAAAEQAGVPMPLASLVHDRFVAALAQGLEQADWAGIARISYQQAGLTDGLGNPRKAR